ncbi:hypothetical protein [Hyalangium sp.]|uniref:hypothetical protein n=1 Tax=Hyalangium sp. TaxID=2028555 RepID=UPI002D40C46E|nr:hypothetical protein [Hyalangium sp.]HYH96897.1 hypothetical protein [Hyalangium sp.]
MSDLVKVESVSLARRAQISEDVLAQEIEQRHLLGKYVKACMVEDTDFGKIPGTDKPTLLKPGAEKLVALFHCEPRFELVKDQCTTDFEKGFFKYTFRCLIVGPNGATLAEGYGSANSRESRYRWRTAKRACPTCGSNAALLTSKKKGEGFFCWAKRGGCGATFPENDTRITTQQLGRVENEDIADLDNTILKMAKKRAQVDGAIALARCSDMFTQDVEDLEDANGHEGDASSPPPPKAPEPSKVQAGPTPPATVTIFSPAPSKTTAQEDDSVNSRPPIVAFGPHRGKMISELSDDALSGTIDLGNKKLMEEPSAKWAPMVRDNLAALETMAKQRGLAPKAALAGEDDVPF